MLKLVDIKKSYKTKDFVQHALNGVSIAFRANEFTSILGASGSGKTTMLNIVGGLDQYDSGDLIIDGVSTKKYKESSWDTYRNNRVGFVFQSYNLIPHQTVLSNVELALTLSGVSKKERKQRAIKALEEVGLKDHVYKLPTQMSGGQMQRVAIARALINDPEIVLADEPTGALDSQTSDQVMDLLQNIAKDRLVIMVTHNPELAKRYTNRIVELKDGEVISDSNPYNPELENLKQETKVKRTNMSFFTAISLSVSNLMTKKARTFITSLAGSIGIIGIAAILALASGINLYIDGIEQETMSAYPLTIDTSGIDITGFMMGTDGLITKPDEEQKTLGVINTISSMFSHQNKNDLKSLKAHIENNGDDINPYVKSIQYKYGISPEIYLENENFKTSQVNPDSIFSSMGMGPPQGLEMISGGSEMGMKSFNELPGDTKLFESQYDVLEGRWPNKNNEAVLVLSENGMISDLTMYSLGLKDRTELMEMFEKLANQEEVTALDTKHDNIKYSDVIGLKYKVIQPADKFSYDKNFEVWVDNSQDEKHMKKVIEEGMDLEIVGVIKSNASTKTPMLSSGIYYPEGLVSDLIKDAAQSDIVVEQLKDPDHNVFTNKPFSEGGSSAFVDAFSFNNFITINEAKLQSAFKVDRNAFNIEVPELDINFDAIEMPTIDLELVAAQIANQLSAPTQEITDIFNAILTQYIETIDIDSITSIESVEKLVEDAQNYIQSKEVQDEINRALEIVSTDMNVNEAINQVITETMSAAMGNVAVVIQTQIESAMTQMMQSMPDAMQNALSIDADAFSNAFEFNMEEEDFFNLMRSLSSQTQSDAQTNLKAMGYRDLNDPTQINLYPKDFSTKENVIEFLSAYNESMTNLGNDDKVVKYTDFVGAMMSSVTTIIDTISYALVAFVAISLVVSSIMIGVITYVSVLERIKEIGILRAIGASKKDIRRVFNAETLIVGFIAGGIGIGVTYLLSIVANIVVLDKFNIPNIAHLEPQAAAILIAISMFLAFVAGLIPSSSAAKKDPVEALRSE